MPAVHSFPSPSNSTSWLRKGLQAKWSSFCPHPKFATEPIERAGGAEAFADTLREKGEERLADSVILCSTCTTVAEFMALEHE
jgi:hypothetical protein